LSVAEELVVLVVAAVAATDLGVVGDELDPLDPFDLFEAKLGLVAQPERGAVAKRQRARSSSTGLSTKPLIRSR
jgi:hypothetical protein